jgi:predicted anti-sigma-YlaC factor YlaD
MIARAGAHLRKFFDRIKGRPAPQPSLQLDCREVVVLVTDYFEAQLLQEVRVAFEEHLKGCPGCTNYVEQMKHTISMLRSLTEKPLFPDNTEELRHLFRTWRQNEQ